MAEDKYLLEVQDIHVHYGQVAAIRGASFNVKKGDFITLFGSNGAGKSTTLRSISGLTQPSKGSIVFASEAIEKHPAHKIVQMGIAHVPEGRRVFKDLSVTENLMLGAFARSDKQEIDKDLQNIFQLFPRLQERKTQIARTMSGGEQQMIAIGRALMSKPQLLLLDEPSLGLAPVIVQQIGAILKEINKQGVTIILVEQNAELALELANYGYVLETGQITMQGKAGQLMNNEHVRKAYLGI